MENLKISVNESNVVFRLPLNNTNAEPILLGLAVGLLVYALLKQ